MTPATNGAAGGFAAGATGPLGAAAGQGGALGPTAAPAGEGLEYSVVVPVFNEERNVRPLIERVSAAMRRIGDPFEIVFVDDGSRDATPTVLRAAVAEYPFVRAVRFTRNFGQEAAVQAGYAHARGRWIIQMDGDLQNPPEDIPKLLALKGDAFDIVYGVRKNRQDPLFRRAASVSMRYVMRRMLAIELPDDISTFRLMRASTAKLLADLPERHKFLSALACWVGARYTTVDVGHAARASGRTKYNVGKLLNHTFDLVVGFSSKPLRYVGMLGLACALVGFLAGARAVAYKLLLGTSVTGWTSLPLAHRRVRRAHLRAGPGAASLSRRRGARLRRARSRRRAHPRRRARFGRAHRAHPRGCSRGGRSGPVGRHPRGGRSGPVGRHPRRGRGPRRPPTRGAGRWRCFVSRGPIAVVGCGFPQLGLLRAARALDLEVVGLDLNPRAVGVPLASRFMEASTGDPDAIAAAVRGAGCTALTTTGSELALTTAAAVAARLGLPFYADPETVRRCQEKDA
nr:glycosyltransferase family 2 protein [Polyangiaceae bacterium]